MVRVNGYAGGEILRRGELNHWDGKTVFKNPLVKKGFEYVGEWEREEFERYNRFLQEFVR